MTLLSDAAPQKSVPSSFIVEVTAQNFMQEVIQASLQVPVLVYFTAAWCGPCKQYGPVLEKVVNEAKGKVRLARVDVDKSPQIAQQFRIQSVPMVYIFLQGQPLDAFSGAIPESQLKQMITQILSATPQGEEVKLSLDEASKLLAEGHAEQALIQFEALIAEDNTNMDAVAGAASAMIALGHLEQAEAVLASVPEASVRHESIVSAKAALTLAQNAPSRDALLQLNARLATNEHDHEARYELAAALFSAGNQEAAIEELLHIIKKDKAWNEGAARTQLLAFFEALGHTHPLTMQGRKKLATILFA